MARFSFLMDDYLSETFYRLFPDHGERSRILRKCIHRIVKQAKEQGGILQRDIHNVADAVYEDIKNERA